jgi:hypothetical protein
MSGNVVKLKKTNFLSRFSAKKNCKFFLQKIVIFFSAKKAALITAPLLMNEKATLTREMCLFS